MTKLVAALLVAIPCFSQTPAATAADAMLARLNTIEWGSSYPPGSSGVTCTERVPVQMDVYATTQWTHHCSGTNGGIVQESFYYVFGEPAHTAELRVDIRPTDESPETTAAVLSALRAKLVTRFGQPGKAPELMEIGFRRERYGQPIAGDHWQHGSLHYFLHANLSYHAPMGVRHGVQLIVMDRRLIREREQDQSILQVEGFGGVFEITKTNKGTPEIARDLLILLRRGGPSDLLAADSLVTQLSVSEPESPQVNAVRQDLARFGVKLGGMAHQGGLEYRHDLLWRVWRDSPNTEAGELAFLDLQRRGWNTDPGEGCPVDPDLFREVIDKGESFLAQHPNTRLRKDVLYTLAVANESWWSIAHAPEDDPIVSAPPYPRRQTNARHSAAARQRAIDYYRQVVQLAPDSSEAASALRRLPRLELGFDTGQRRFFCSYC